MRMGQPKHPALPCKQQVCFHQLLLSASQDVEQGLHTSTGAAAIDACVKSQRVAHQGRYQTTTQALCFSMCAYRSIDDLVASRADELGVCQHHNRLPANPHLYFSVFANGDAHASGREHVWVFGTAWRAIRWLSMPVPATAVEAMFQT